LSIHVPWRLRRFLLSRNFPPRRSLASGRDAHARCLNRFLHRKIATAAAEAPAG
jgi:hypothetical protein